MEETADILSDEDMLTAIRRGLDDLAARDVVSLEQVPCAARALDRLAVLPGGRLPVIYELRDTSTVRVVAIRHR